MRLTGGFRLLVGRDLDERERLHDIMLAAARWSIAVVVVLGLAGGFFVTRRVLKRIDAMSGTTPHHHGGRPRAGACRSPAPATSSTAWRESLNAMLERIEALMHGLKEVSDNIAHDLQDPAHAAAQPRRGGPAGAAQRRRLPRRAGDRDRGIGRPDPDVQRAADDRARRSRAGRRDDMTEFDAAEIVHDVTELYEPLAEEKGLRSSPRRKRRSRVKGNRELISQALANLLDNAIKYAAPSKRRRRCAASRDAGRRRGTACPRRS